MEQRISVITLGVADLKRSKQFYERLGWRRSLAKAEGIVFFQAGGMGLALYPREFLTSRRILRVNARRNGPTGSRQQFRIPAFLPFRLGKTGELRYNKSGLSVIPTTRGGN
jgi:catechol 2,3-dioxygenase-like lactoylglutathione lyase family enzyme